MISIICDYSFNTLIAFYIKDGNVIKIDFEYPDNIGNIYYGKIANKLENINAFFMYINKEINIFVQDESVKEDTPIQVTKAAQGKKCMRGTQNIFLTGRYIIYYPREIQTGAHINCDNIPGLIILRPNARDLSYELLRKDAINLHNIWQQIINSNKRGLIYEDNNIINRILRDIKEDDQLIVSNQKLYSLFKSSYLIENISVEIFDEKEFGQSLLGYYDLYKVLESLNAQSIRLESGSNIVFGITEALIAIDVNSGNSSISYTEINIQAAKIIVEQILLRNLSGLIVIDFLKVNNIQDNEKLHAYLKLLFANDVAQTSVRQVNSLGLVEITRQHTAPSLNEIMSIKCSCCNGLGTMLSNKFAALEILYKIQNQLSSKEMNQIHITLPKVLAYFILNNKKNALLEMERKYRCKIIFNE